MNLLPLTQAMVGKFGEYYDEDYVKEEKFYHIQSELGQYVKLFNSEWDYSLQQPEHLEMWRFVTDHLIRWLTIPNVRYDLERTQTTVDALRCVTRMNCAKKQFDDWITVYKITRFYITNDKIQLKSLNLLYNLCLDENNKQTFITTKGMYTLIHIFKNHMDEVHILSEILDLVRILSCGQSANYRWYSIQKTNIIPYILLAMQRHPLDPGIQDKACNVLNLLAYSESMESQIVKLGGQQIVCKVLSIHGFKNAVLALQSLIKLSTSHTTFNEDRWYGIRFIIEMFQRHATDLKMLNELVKLVNHLATYHPSYFTAYDNHRSPSPLAQRLVQDKCIYNEIRSDDIKMIEMIKMIEEEAVKPTPFEIPFDEREHTFGKEDVHDAPYLPVRKSSLFIFGVRVPTTRPSLILRRSSLSDEEDEESVESVDIEKKKVENVLGNPTNLVDVVIRLAGIVDDDVFFKAIHEMAKTSSTAFELICRDVTRHVIRYSFVNSELAFSVLSLLISNFPLYVISNRECNIPDAIVSLLKKRGYDTNGLLRTIFGREAGSVINESLHYTDRTMQFLILCGVALSSDFRSRIGKKHHLILYRHVQQHFASIMKNTLDQTTSMPSDINHLISQFVYS